MKSVFTSLAILSAVLAQPASALDNALSDPELAELRGGFTTRSGLTISFGIEHATWINGVLRTRQELRVGDISLGRAGIAPSATTASILEPVVIQNSLNQQLIQNQTIISVTINGAALARQWGHASFLNDQIMRFAR